MTELQEKAIEVLKKGGFTETEDGGYHYLRNGIPVHQKWLPIKDKDGFLRFDRLDGQWIPVERAGIGNGEVDMVFTSQSIIDIYSQ